MKCYKGHVQKDCHAHGNEDKKYGDEHRSQLANAIIGEDQGDQNVLSPKTGYTNQLDVLNSMARDIFVVDEIIHMWVLDLNEV